MVRESSRTVFSPGLIQLFHEEQQIRKAGFLAIPQRRP
jgi:hypothetical protein